MSTAQKTACFVLCSFLLAHPIFLKDLAQQEQEKTKSVQGAEADEVAFRSNFSIRSFIYQRLTRIYPAYFFAMIFNCLIINPKYFHSTTALYSFIAVLRISRVEQRIVPIECDAFSWPC